MDPWLTLKTLPSKQTAHYTGRTSHLFTTYVVHFCRKVGAIWIAAISLPERGAAAAVVYGFFLTHLGSDNARVNIVIWQISRCCCLCLKATDDKKTLAGCVAGGVAFQQKWQTRLFFSSFIMNLYNMSTTQKAGKM